MANGYDEKHPLKEIGRARPIFKNVSRIYNRCGSFGWPAEVYSHLTSFSLPEFFEKSNRIEINDDQVNVLMIFA